MSDWHSCCKLLRPGSVMNTSTERKPHLGTDAAAPESNVADSMNFLLFISVSLIFKVQGYCQLLNIQIFNQLNSGLKKFDFNSFCPYIWIVRGHCRYCWADKYGFLPANDAARQMGKSFRQNHHMSNGKIPGSRICSNAGFIFGIACNLQSIRFVVCFNQRGCC